MNQRDIDSAVWEISRSVKSLEDEARETSYAKEQWAVLCDSLGDDPSTETIIDFFQLAFDLINLWGEHSQGHDLRGDLTASTLKDVLDRNILLSEQAGTTSVPALS
jgi:hypothetical protein